MLTKEDMERYSREYYLPVYKYCMSRLKNKVDAEDATQETFIVFYEKGHMLEDIHVKAWLFATAHNKILSEYKRRMFLKDKESVYDEELKKLSRVVVSFEESLVDYYIDKYIDEIYKHLSDKEKELFDLCCDNTLKTGDIAKILGLEPHACSMRKKRLRDRCREIMLEILFF